LYNGGGSDISDSESCIPEGYTATGEKTATTATATATTTTTTTTTTITTTTTTTTTITTTTTTAPTDGTPQYQKLNYGADACPAGLEIESEDECSEAIASLGVTDGGAPWIGSRDTMPKFCTLQKHTNTMVFNWGVSGSGRHDLAPICRLPKYQKLNFGAAACPAGLEIESEDECSVAIASLGVTDGGAPWTGSRDTMPKFCSLQKNTNTMVFNWGVGGSGRHDLAPVCRLSV